MQVTFDPDEDELERVVALIEALYDVEVQVAKVDPSRGKMRH